MKNLIFMLLACFMFGCGSPTPITQQEYQWESLMEDDLSQWDTYLSYAHKVGYDGSVPTDAAGNEIAPVGLNKDSYGVFSVVKDGDESVVRVSGEYYGCIATKASFRNYHLQLKIKWGDIKWDPRKKLLKDSGILYHSIGPHGAEHWRSWMLSQEFQVMQGHFGDFWKQANSAIDIRAYIPEYVMPPTADTTQAFIGVGTDEDIEFYCMRSRNMEKPLGEWNTLDLICYEGKSLHIVNGEVVMVLQNSRYIEDGIAKPLVEGKIQLQSEAAELFYKDIKIRTLEDFPAKYSRYFN